jgi:hypothetical protein
MKQLKQMTVPEFLALCRLKACKKQVFKLYLPPTVLPPVKPFKRVEIKDEVMGARVGVYIRPNPNDGGWIAKVEIKYENFNTIPIGEVLQRK